MFLTTIRLPLCHSKVLLTLGDLYPMKSFIKLGLMGMTGGINSLISGNEKLN
jgi:hypothetical protein